MKRNGFKLKEKTEREREREREGGAMDKLPFKLHKSENNTDLTFLPKLRKNIQKYYRLNLANEIVIGLKHDLQKTPESAASLCACFLV